MNLWQSFLELSGINTCSQAVQRKSLFSHLTVAMQDVVQFQLDVDPVNTELAVAEIVEKMRAFIRAKYNVTLDKITFNRRHQKANETFDFFVADLRRLWIFAELCPNCKDDTIRTQMLVGMRNEAARLEVLKESPTPPLAECIDLIRSVERAKTDNSTFADASAAAAAATLVN